MVTYLKAISFSSDCTKITRGKSLGGSRLRNREVGMEYGRGNLEMVKSNT